MALNITDQTFKTEVLDSKLPVLIDFWAEWCGPCKMLGPIIDELSIEMSNIKIGKINIDENPSTPSEYGVRGIPTMMLFHEGKLLDTKVGVLPKAAIMEWINSKISL